MTAEELQNRLKSFAYRMIPFCEALPGKKISISKGQLTRSSISAAAHYNAACKPQSEIPFKSKVRIAFKEIDGSLFWLETIHDPFLSKLELHAPEFEGQMHRYGYLMLRA